MKKNTKIKIIFFISFVLFFPIDFCLLEEISQDENENNLKYYIGGLLIILLVSSFFYYGDNFEFLNFNKFESDIEYRPPRNINDFNPPRCPVYQIQQTILK